MVGSLVRTGTGRLPAARKSWAGLRAFQQLRRRTAKISLRGSICALIDLTVRVAVDKLLYSNARAIKAVKAHLSQELDVLSISLIILYLIYGNTMVPPMLFSRCPLLGLLCFDSAFDGGMCFSKNSEK